MTTNLETMAEVAAAHEAGHIVEVYDSYVRKWVPWQCTSWHNSNEYRIAEPPPKPPVTMKFLCFAADGELRWVSSTHSTLRHWVRVPLEDKTVEVMP